MTRVTKITILDEMLDIASLHEWNWEVEVKNRTRNWKKKIFWLKFNIKKKVEDCIYQRTNRLLVKRGSNQDKSFYNFENLSNTWDINIIYKWNELKINQELKKRIWIYIKNAHQIENIEWYKSWFDCGSLVHFLNGMFCRNMPILWTCWNYKKWLFYNEEEAIKVWDTILISNKKQEHKNEKNNTIPTSSVKLAYSWHFAVYIWKWFFISKIWRYNNKLSITTLENLKNIYNMKHYLLMRLKKENINKENL